MTPPHDLRFPVVGRRALLRRGATLATGLAVLGLAGCGNGDAATLADADPSTTTVASAEPTDGSDPTVGSTTTGSDAPAGTDDSTTSAGASDEVLSGEAVVSFTYTASNAGGRVNNPYIAVWIEDESGDLVDPLALWYEQGGKGSRWLSDLTRWTAVEDADDRVDTVTGATRTPGDYQLVWDLTDLDGDAVAPGTYYVCIESAREHGPYSLIREAVELDGSATTIELTDEGELSGANLDVEPA
ncbi:MAG: DUF2271 domain-containing protein [Acidimicrobiales bacterium]